MLPVLRMTVAICEHVLPTNRYAEHIHCRNVKKSRIAQSIGLDGRALNLRVPKIVHIPLEKLCSQSARHIPGQDNLWGKPMINNLINQSRDRQQVRIMFVVISVFSLLAGLAGIIVGNCEPIFYTSLVHRDCTIPCNLRL